MEHDYELILQEENTSEDIRSCIKKGFFLNERNGGKSNQETYIKTACKHKLYSQTKRHHTKKIGSHYTPLEEGKDETKQKKETYD